MALAGGIRATLGTYSSWFINIKKVCCLSMMLFCFCLMNEFINSSNAHRSLKQTAGSTSCPWTTILVLLSLCFDKALSEKVSFWGNIFALVHRNNFKVTFEFLVLECLYELGKLSVLHPRPNHQFSYMILYYILSIYAERYRSKVLFFTTPTHACDQQDKVTDLIFCISLVLKFLRSYIIRTFCWV